MTDLSRAAQAGILQPIPPLGRYLTFTLADAEQARDALRALREIVDGDECVLGFSESLVESLDASIEGLRPFPALMGPGIEVPSTHGALWCWLRNDDRGHLIQATRDLDNHLAPAFALIDVVDAFKHDVHAEIGRDLTGYEDGTENPQDDEAIAAALTANRGRGLDGGSFVAVQQWIHNLDRFDDMSDEDQDDCIGRRKSDNAELDDAPESAHVKRTAQESFSPEAFVLRRSMPWADDANQGLMFVAFGHSFDAFEAQLKRMAGLEDGIVDALFKFTRPVTGNYYWCPPMKNGKLDLSAMGLG
jgi:putative iron-dependent peroxidase